MQYRLRVCSTGRGCTVQAEGNSLHCIFQPVYCRPSACLLHTLTVYTAHPHPVYCTPSPCTAHMYLIQGGPDPSYIYMDGGDLDAFGKPVHKDCFQKMHSYVFEIHRWLLAFPEISIVKPCAPLMPLYCFKQILKQASKILHIYKEDDVLLEIPRNQVTWVNITQTGYRCFHFRILANQSKEKQSSIFSTC